jgi:hypothetical protein
MFDHIMTTDSVMWCQDRGDFVFSNWVFFWFVFYYAGFIKYSPFLAILIGVVANSYEYLTSQKGKELCWKQHYILRNLIIKVVPTLLIVFSVDNRIKWRQDIISILLVYGTFRLWVYINGLMGAVTNKPTNPFNFNIKETKF